MAGECTDYLSPSAGRRQPLRCRLPRRGGQNGQALAESLAVLGVLGSLWVGIAWLGRLQDIGLQLSHASRRAAFAHAHQGMVMADLPEPVSGYARAPGHIWQTRQGNPLLSAGVWVRLDASARVPEYRPGDPVAGAAGLRQELALGLDFVWLARTGAYTTGLERTRRQLSDIDRPALSLQRHTAILSGTGAAAGDGAVQATLADSPRAWSGLADASRAAGSQADRRLRGVDEAWGRPRPTWDWLSSWAGQVPARHLKPWSSP